ncbi:hypothetical protein BGW38_010274 [Lunasporangiospora selenospora]|uniref:Uncharacterized protein n=1 Tax=Lunasporangiospora selenospora TaxID=979761 RepID=A0A9P6KFK9_9FUNG|nr:hypothetical protein BGW38_010274 [Lunasporangiospora selenospora]
MSCPAGYSAISNTLSATAAIAETLQPGDQYCFYGENIVWSEHHLKPSQLAPFRVIGDDLSDNALDILKIKREENAYDALIEYISKPEEEQASQAPRLLYDQMMRVPEWVDWDQICRGQQVHW